MYAVSRPTKELIGLFERAKTLEKKQDKSRNAIFNNALLIVDDFSDEDWLNISETKVNFNFDVKLPTSLKVEVHDVELYQKIITKFKGAFKLERVKISYFMKLCLKAYVCKLESENFNNQKSDMMLEDNPIISQIDIWIQYSINEPQCPYTGNEMIHDIYRALNDTDCKLTGGNLLSDMIFSTWFPLKMTLECLNQNRRFYKVDKYSKDQYRYLKEIKSNIETLLPRDKEVVKKLYEFFSIANTRGNIMILPNRSMQIRGKDYLDQMPKTLYECFEGGEFSRYFGGDLTVENWVEREHLEVLFFDGNIKRDRIKPILKSKKANEFYWLIDEKEIISMLENCILVIQKRNAIYKK